MSEFQDRFIAVARRKGFLDDARVAEAFRLLAEAQGRNPGVRLHHVLLGGDLLTREQLLDIRRTMAAEGVHFRLGEYEILSRIGRGSMGTVYRARQPRLDRIVAIKVLASHLAINERYVARFLREARLAARVNHPNMVQVYDVAQWRGMHYIVMEYIEGASLEQALAGGQPLPEERVVRIGIEVARLLERAEFFRIVHRDIKPGNILLAKDGRVKVADLGLAWVENEANEEGVGTPAYLAPEQARGAAELDSRTDMYALGCTLFHAVTGRPPYPGATVVETVRMHAEAPIPDARARNPRISRAFSALLRRLMAKHPVERFSHMAEVTERLEQISNQKELTPKSPARFSPLKLALVMVLAMSLAAALMLALALFLKARTPDAAPPGVESSREF